jgi:hypothetical protein
MRSFFYMGVNPKNKSGVSWKIWKIERSGRRVRVQWGPAILVNRSVRPKGSLQDKTLSFSSEGAARSYERSRVRSKLTKGYERKPQPRTE